MKENWISVKNKKPEHEQRVLVVSSEIYHPFVCRFLGNGMFIPLYAHLEAIADYDYSDAEINIDFNNESITHWLPIPNKPKKK